jgi:hypothetical protein
MTRLDVVFVALLSGSLGSVIQSVQLTAKPNDRVIADFRGRIEKYVELRNKADAAAPPLKETANPAEIRAAQIALAQRIASLRAGAKPGDVFTPEIAAYFRRLLRPELTEQQIKAAIRKQSRRRALESERPVSGRGAAIDRAAQRSPDIAGAPQRHRISVRRQAFDPARWASESDHRLHAERDPVSGAKL